MGLVKANRYLNIMNHNHQRRQRNELKNVEQTLKEEANHNKNEQLHEKMVSETAA